MLTEDVHQKHKTAKILTKSNSNKTNAMHANHAHRDRFTTDRITDVLLNRLLDHNAHVLNNSTSNSTDVTTVQMANSQETLTLSKVVSADNTHRTVVTKSD
jgi:hypothetical protein